MHSSFFLLDSAIWILAAVDENLLDFPPRQNLLKIFLILKTIVNSSNLPSVSDEPGVALETA